MGLNRVADSVAFDTGIASAGWASGPVGQTIGGTQRDLMPGTATVVSLADGVIAPVRTVSEETLRGLAMAGDSPELRGQAAFCEHLRKAVSELRADGGGVADKAAVELERLLADGELLADYRAGTLEK